MPDYSQGKIYRLVSKNTDEVYIGSTTITLEKRLDKHYYSMSSWKNGKSRYVTSYKILEAGDVSIELLEECNVSCMLELHKREKYYIENNKCVNSYLPGQDVRSNMINYKADYYQKNSEKIKACAKNSYIKNQEHNLIKKKEHYQKNREKILAKKKEMYEKNREQIVARRRENYQKNRENIIAKKKENYQKNKAIKVI